MQNTKGEGSGFGAASGSEAPSGSGKQVLVDPSQLLMEEQTGPLPTPYMIINDPNKAKKFSQRIKIKGVVHELHYQDLKL